MGYNNSLAQSRAEEGGVMLASLYRSWSLLFLVVACWGIHSSSPEAADPPAKVPPAKPAIDFSKLPPGTIFLIGDDPKEALQRPGVMIVTAEELDRIIKFNLEQ